MKNILGPDSCASVPGSGLSRRLLVLEACWGVDLSCKSSVAVPVSQEGQVCCSEAAESSEPRVSVSWGHLGTRMAVCWPARWAGYGSVVRVSHPALGQASHRETGRARWCTKLRAPYAPSGKLSFSGPRGLSSASSALEISPGVVIWSGLNTGKIPLPQHTLLHLTPQPVSQSRGPAARADRAFPEPLPAQPCWLRGRSMPGPLECMSLSKPTGPASIRSSFQAWVPGPRRVLV